MYGSEGFSIYDIILWAQGLGVSVGVFILSMTLGLLLGVAIGLIRYYQIAFLGKTLMMISEFLKNSPIIVQLFLVYFGIPAVTGIDMTPIEAAVWTLSANTAAFIAVIIISSISSIEPRQLEAARSFALSEFVILRKIIFPQAFSVSIPLLVGLAINQLQVTSLISVIGVYDLTRVGDIVNQRTFEPFIVWPIIGATYFILAKLLAHLGTRLERRFSQHKIMSEL